ncbi:MAG: TolC family outer membrane protein [Porticoccaceae bacterium]|jgi:outer membrane protein|nr:TolC family outer membrane protein [Porticoccaceae bacterium]
MNQVRKIYFGCFVLAALIFTATRVSAEDLIGLWAIAEKQDGKYLSAKYRYLADAESIKQTRAQLLPTISYNYEDKNTDQVINESDNAVFNLGKDNYTTTTKGFRISQAIFDYARWSRYKQSKIFVNKSEIEYQLAKQELLLRLAESYFLVLERGDQFDTVQDEKTAMSKHLSLSELKFKSGLGMSADVEDARARYLSTLSKEFELKSRLDDSRYALREVLGEIPVSIASLRSDIEFQKPIPDVTDEWVAMSARQNLELQAMTLSLNVAEKEVSALKAARYPTVNLVYSDLDTVTDGSVFGGGSDINNADIQLQLNVPIYTGGATSSKIRQAIQKKLSVVEDIKDKRRSVERAAQDAFNRVHTAIVQIEALGQAVKAQERLLQTYSSGYRGGKNSILDVLDTQQDLSQAKQSLTKARYDYVLNTLRLKFTAGDLQVDDLISINGWLSTSASGQR